MNWVIETKRLRLREFDMSDASAFYALNADPKVLQNTGDKPFKTVEEAGQLIVNYDQYKQHGFGRWTVVSQETHEVLGWCGLKKHKEGFVDIGFRFFKKYWGKGYATEAAQACLEYGFNQKHVDEIIGRTSEENKASIRILEKIGLKYWKHDSCEGIENSIYYKIQKRL